MSEYASFDVVGFCTGNMKKSQHLQTPCTLELNDTSALMEPKPAELEGYHLLGHDTFQARLSLWDWEKLSLPYLKTCS
jgi:hypothetical protein